MERKLISFTGLELLHSSRSPPSRAVRLFLFLFGISYFQCLLIIFLFAAVQCNLSGQPYWMITEDAPDPRDVFWKNVGADRLTIESRKILVQCILLLGILGWGTIATYINRFTLKTIGTLPLGLSPAFVQGEPVHFSCKNCSSIFLLTLLGQATSPRLLYL